MSARIDGAAPASSSIEQVLPGRGLRAVFQPIVHLDTGAVVAYEALARGPEGSTFESPQALLEEAGATGMLASFDWRRRLAALEAAATGGYPASLPLFLNTEPGSLTETVPVEVWEAIRAGVRGRCIVMEFTERSLADNPRAVLEAADSARLAGIYIALDDVGAEPMSLALLHILRPDVVKLDLRLLQNRDVSSEPIVHAVRDYAESAGALVLAEGIETEEHIGIALSLGAMVGQGWYFGRPAALPTELPAGHPGLLRRTQQPSYIANSPFDVAIAHARVPRRASRRNLLPLSVSLEHAAEREEIPPLLLAGFQNEQRFTAHTARRYRKLAATCPLVAAFGVGMSEEPAAGVKGIDVAAIDPFAEEWTVIVVGAHHTVALLARPSVVGSPSDADQMFDYIVTHDRDAVVAAARHALRRIGKPSSIMSLVASG